MIWRQGLTLKKIEERAIEECLDFFDGNKTRAAKELGVSIRTIRNKVAERRNLERFKRTNQRQYKYGF